MADHNNNKDSTTTWQELAYSNMVQLEALTRQLINKGLITKDEILEEVQAVHKALRREKEKSNVK